MGRRVGVIIRGDVNCVPERQNCVLKVTQLPEALETSFEALSEVAKMGRLVRVPARSDINNILERRNCALEVTQFPEVLETNFQGVA